MKDVKKSIIAAVILVLLAIYICTSNAYIRLGYYLKGGSTGYTEDAQQHISELERDYWKFCDTYNRYKDSDNPTAQTWAKNAKDTANSIADTYNEYFEQEILKRIGE